MPFSVRVLVPAVKVPLFTKLPPTACASAPAGKVTPAVDRSYPLAQTAAAIRYLREGKARGKVVIRI